MSCFAPLPLFLLVVALAFASLTAQVGPLEVEYKRETDTRVVSFEVKVPSPTEGR